MKNLTPELIAKAKAAKNTEELFELAKTNNVDLSETEAKTYFEQLSANGAVSDEELDAVVGGGCGDDDDDANGNKEDTGYQEGDVVKFFDGTTCSCGCSTFMIGRAPHLPHGAYLRCTNCQKIVFDQLPYDRFTKI